ncbi:MAG: hypothetical protein EOO06_14325 [Chitinophagaceae bacterium]|nr:MAG: hypothetical protein EOO06_14325 [Chitinophagaceae bacterium]
MRQLIAAFIIVSNFQNVSAQQVGIGTSTPATTLHVYDAAGNSIIRSETNGAATQSAVELKTGTNAFDFLELRKWISGSGGSQAGIPLNGLSVITTGSNTTGGLLIGTKPPQPLYFTTDNIERMRINALGNVRIGNNLGGNNRLAVTADDGAAIFARTNFVAPPGSYIGSIQAIINNSAGSGAAVVGITENAALSTPGIPLGMYGVVGGAVDQGYGMGAFGVAGAGGIYASTIGSGKALRTSGAIQLEGIGAGLGKVLTSDAAGNASWQTISGASHNHYGESWSGVDDFAGLQITTNSASPARYGISGISNGNIGIGVGGSSLNDNGIGVSGIVYHDGIPYPTLEANTGVHGLNSTGTGVYASSMTGYALKVLKQNWLSVTGPTALLKNERTTNTAPVVVIENEASNPTALELKNGYIKVSGSNKMAFSHTTAAGNIVNNWSAISYPNAASTDIVFLTHNYNPTSTYFNYNYGVFWNGTTWAVYIETPATPMPVNINFNVMVIKQ